MSAPKDPRIILCPGQGAQAIGMGKAWADASPEAAAIFRKADDVLADRLGAPLSTLCFEGPADTLNRTDVSQPAIYVASVACWAGFLAQWNAGGFDEANVTAVAGLSLGEYTALHLAGAFSFEDGLELVTLRGRAMQDAAEATPSGMVALIGADEQQATEVCDQARAGDVLVCANFNAPGQVVLSGSIDACRRAEQVAADKSIRSAALPVAGAFHSPLMAPAAERLRAALDATPVNPPACDVVSNVTATQHAPSTGRTIEDTIRDRLEQQLTSPVRWADGCKFLAGRTDQPAPAFHELAPGKTLAGLMRRIERSIKVESHDGPQ